MINLENEIACDLRSVINFGDEADKFELLDGIADTFEIDHGFGPFQDSAVCDGHG